MSKKRYIDIVPRQRYMSGRMGQLMVADCREIYPGDFIRYKVSIGCHLSPMQAPEMSPLIIRQDTFFVPNRILWNYWDNYISQKLLGDSAVGPFDENQLLPPQLVLMHGVGFNGPVKTHLFNVRGVYDLLEGLGYKPTTTNYEASSAGSQYYTGTILNVNAFPLMAYWRIWHDYYRDAFLQNDEFVAATASGVPLQGDPWADESPVSAGGLADNVSWSIPLGSRHPSYSSLPGAELPGYNLLAPSSASSPFLNWHLFTRGIFTFYKRQPAAAIAIKPDGNGSVMTNGTILPGAAVAIPLDFGTGSSDSPIEPGYSIGMYAPVCMPKDYFFSLRQSPVYNEDVAVPEGVRDLRKAFQVLGYREKVNRFDNRIKSWMRSMFHVNISDKRLDSPYWLGGSQSVINTQEVLGTVNNSDTVLGQLGGFAVGSVRSRVRKFRSEEHGFLMTLFSVVPLPVYGDSVSRYWYKGNLTEYSRTPRFDGSLDYALPDFQRIGMQAVYLGEIRGSVSADQAFRILGYSDRFADLGFSNCDVCGDFRTTLRFWHTGLFFNNSITPNVSVGELPLPYSGMNGTVVSMFPRNQNNIRINSRGTYTPSISSTLSARLFDAGNTADQFWFVVATDFYASRRFGTHSHPGYADHTSKN